MNDMNATPELPAGWRRRRTAWIAAGILAIALLVYALSPRLLTAAGNQLIHSDPLQRADVIMVLAPLLDRIVEAATLYRQGYAPFLIIAPEARLFAEWASMHRIRRAIVVTSPPHTYRSRLTFIRAVENLNLQILVHPSSRHPFRGDSWWRSRRTLRDGLLEWQKLIYYRLIELPRMTPPAARHQH